MKTLCLLICISLASNTLVCSQEKQAKINGIRYVIDLGKSTASVGNNFKKLKGLVKGYVTIPAHIQFKGKMYPVTTIKDIAFLCCRELRSVSIPSSVSNIGYKPFAGLPDIEQIIVSPQNPKYASVNGILFDKEKSELVYYPTGRKDTIYSIPEGTISIGTGSFYNNERLKHVNIPLSVAAINKEAFSFCSTLIEVKIPENVKQIEDEAFSYCRNLTKVVYYNSKMKISPKAFTSCLNLNGNVKYEVPIQSMLARANSGNLDDQYALANCYLKGEGVDRNPIEAIKWLEKAANANYAAAQYTLGTLYYDGKDVVKNTRKALDLFNKAAKNGNISSQRILGTIYFQGKGVKMNAALSMKWFEAAAKQGDGKSQSDLGDWYYHGYNRTKKNYKTAVIWYKQAAENQIGSAQYQLAICYNEGMGTAKNAKEALKWIKKAVENGIEKGRTLLCILSYNNAVNNMNNKSYQSAINDFDDVLRYDKTNANAYLNRGYCYLNIDSPNYEKARNDFKQALAIEPKNTVAQNNLEVVENHNRRLKEADDLTDMGDSYYKHKDYENAVSCYAKSIALDNSKPYPYYSIGYCYYDCNLYGEAIKYFNKALRS